ncbi:MAG: cold shock domain-containing protein, partial [Saprospiraceae bacterium]
MSKSQETYNKKEKEKKRLKKREDKRQRKAERKAAPKRTGDQLFSYVDENGYITDTPPDPLKKRIIKAEDIKLGVPHKTAEDLTAPRVGKIEFFNSEKGYGFIKEDGTNEKFFVHVKGLLQEVV